MPLYQAIILGAVQGLTEIFPISSSGHLIIFPELLGWQPHSLSFDAALHLGTAFALLWWFDKAWINLFKTRSWRMIAFILLASVPVGLAGLFGRDFIEEYLRSPRLVAISLITVAILMVGIEALYRRERSPKKEASLGDVLLIGFSQAFALIPGVSRSGITISIGMSKGIKRDRAAHFSFLISIPIVLAAGLYQLFDVWQAGELAVQGPNFAAGILTSFVVGLFAIRFLFKILRKYSLLPFAFYRIALGIFLLWAL